VCFEKFVVILIQFVHGAGLLSSCELVAGKGAFVCVEACPRVCVGYFEFVHACLQCGAVGHSECSSADRLVWV
jgi:hypothetical protein